MRQGALLVRHSDGIAMLLWTTGRIELLLAGSCGRPPFSCPGPVGVGQRPPANSDHDQPKGMQKQLQRPGVAVREVINGALYWPVALLGR